MYSLVADPVKIHIWGQIRLIVRLPNYSGMNQVKRNSRRILWGICRTLLAQQGPPGHVAERCLNHKLKGVEGIYDRHDYFEERREALNMLALHISEFADL